MEWISVKDGTPHNNQEVLVSIGDLIVTARYWSLTGKFLSCDARISGGIPSYWMPLPEPPKKGA